MGGLHLVDLLVSLVLAMIMFGVGLTLTGREFQKVVTRPKNLLLSLTSQILILPIIAFIIASLSWLSPEFRVGLVILAASPGGATSGFIAYLFRANTALSITMTTVNSFLCLFSIPVVVNLAVRFFMATETEIHLPFWETVVQIFSITIIPATLGILVSRQWPIFARKAGRPVRNVMLVLLAVVFCIKIFAKENQGGANLSVEDIGQILPFAVLQNICCLFFGFFFLKKWGADHPSRLTAAIESGVQNTTLAFLIAGTLLANQQMVKPSLIYSMFSFFTACAFCYYSNQKAGKPESNPFTFRNQ